MIKNFEALSPEELLAWLKQTRAKLAMKYAQERNYLDRRAKRGTHTYTDIQMEEDQVMLLELIRFLEEGIGAAERELHRQQTGGIL